MRAIFIIFISFSCFINKSKSQSIGETQLWVKSTLENYFDRDSYDRQVWVYFDNDKIWFTQLESGGTVHKEISIKDINQVIVKPTAIGYTLILGCRYDKNCCEIVHYKMTDEGTAKKSYTESARKAAYEVYLTSGLQEDNMSLRLKKAIIHLIKLHGGKVVSDVF
jgi:hypothetical protein